MSYAIEIYRLDPVSGAFTPLDQFDTFNSLTFFDKGSGMGGCNFVLDINTIKAKASVLRRSSSQVAIKKNNTIVWVGPITKILRNYRGVGGTIQIQAESYLSHLFSRFTASVVNFTGIDAGTIASSLIATTQALDNGALLITSSVETTVDRDRTYYFKNVGEAIDELSKVNGGFDFDFSYTQDSNHKLTGIVFNVYAHRGRTRLDLDTLRLGKNVQATNYATQEEIANTITALGVGTGDGRLSSVQTDAGSQQSFTRRELVLPQTDISIQSSLDEAALGRLHEVAGERYHVECEMKPGSGPRFGDFVIGDILKLDLNSDPSSFITLETSARTIEQSISIDPNGAELLGIKFTVNI